MPRLSMLLAGDYWSDAGAFMGVMPYSMWHKKVQTDELRRLKMHLNLLLIQTAERNILVDTGLGNRLTDRQKQIYNPSEFLLPASLLALGLQPEDITDVIITHLHFDHAGGIVTQLSSSASGEAATDVLTFPHAIYHIQKTEWDTAKNPDQLNKAAYQFEHQIALLETEGKVNLLEGDSTLYDCIHLYHTGGHTAGMQIVEVNKDDKSYIYAGDIIPSRFHMHLVVTSAYDVSRAQSVAAKQLIYEKLRDTEGILLLDHDTEAWQIPYTDIPL